MNQIMQVFNNPEFGQVRTLTKDGEIWFVGKDVADALGYERTTKAVQDHVDNEDKGVIPIQDSIGRMQNTPIINESGLYSLILSSKLPLAKKFKRWVTSEVLPSIRKTGQYSVSNQLTIDDWKDIAKYILQVPKDRFQYLLVVLDKLAPGEFDIRRYQNGTSGNPNKTLRSIVRELINNPSAVIKTFGKNQYVLDRDIFTEEVTSIGYSYKGALKELDNMGLLCKHNVGSRTTQVRVNGGRVNGIVINIKKV